MCMSIYPSVNGAILDILRRFEVERIRRTLFEVLWVGQLKRRRVMTDHDLMLSRAVRHRLLDKGQAMSMQFVIVLCLDEAVAIDDSREVGQEVLHFSNMLTRDVRPHRRNDQVHVTDSHYVVKDVEHVGTHIEPVAVF